MDNSSTSHDYGSSEGIVSREILDAVRNYYQTHNNSGQISDLKEHVEKLGLYPPITEIENARDIALSKR